jgi:hypothetical protein
VFSNSLRIRYRRTVSNQPLRCWSLFVGFEVWFSRQTGGFLRRQNLDNVSLVHFLWSLFILAMLLFSGLVLCKWKWEIENLDLSTAYVHCDFYCLNHRPCRFPWSRNCTRLHRVFPSLEIRSYGIKEGSFYWWVLERTLMPWSVQRHAEERITGNNSTCERFNGLTHQRTMTYSPAFTMGAFMNWTTKPSLSDWTRIAGPSKNTGLQTSAARCFMQRYGALTDDPTGRSHCQYPGRMPAARRAAGYSTTCWTPKPACRRLRNVGADDDQCLGPELLSLW